MKSKQKKQAGLKVCVLGFDSRAYSALKFFFKNKCNNRVTLVEMPDAEVGIIDMDSFTSQSVLNDFRERYPERDLILLALGDAPALPGVDFVYVKKPAQPEAMLEAIDQVRARREAQKAEAEASEAEAAQTAPKDQATGSVQDDPDPVAAMDFQPLPEVYLSDTTAWGTPVDASAASPVTEEPKSEPAAPAAPAAPAEPVERSNLLDAAEPSLASSSGRRIFAARTIPKSITSAAMLLDERGFGEYIGSLKDIDPDNPSEVRVAQYDPKAFFQGYLQAACRRARETNCVMRLYTGWRPVTVFPQTREVLIDADEQQLRAFCLVPVHSIADLDYCDPSGGIMTIKPAALAGPPEAGEDASKLQRIETLLWNVALWTSAGRMPKDIDLHAPIYLRHWPNLPRLLVFPHAMRVAALLSDHPRSVMDVVRTLDIRQQYVFAFVSAARALGLIERPSRTSSRRAGARTAEPAEGTGILKKLLRRLTGR